MQDSYQPGESPFGTVPPVILAIAGAMLLAELAFMFGAQGYVGGPQAVGWRAMAIQDYGINGRVVELVLVQGLWEPGFLLRFVSYIFVHGGFTHMAIAAVMVLALGKMVGEVFSLPATLAVIVVPVIVGAAGWGLILGDTRWLIGGFPAVYGLIGAFTYILWTRLGRDGGPRHRAFALIAFLMGIQLVFGLLFGGSSDWLADLIAFATGFALSFVVAPGGWRGLRERMRHS